MKNIQDLTSECHDYPVKQEGDTYICTKCNASCSVIEQLTLLTSCDKLVCVSKQGEQSATRLQTPEG